MRMRIVGIIITWLYLSLLVMISTVARPTETFSVMWMSWVTCCIILNHLIPVASKMKSRIFFFESMKSCMFSTCHQLQIFTSIISRIFVNVMDYFIQCHFSLNHILHYSMAKRHGSAITNHHKPPVGIFRWGHKSIVVAWMICASPCRSNTYISHFCFIFRVFTQPLTCMCPNKPKWLPLFQAIPCVIFNGYLGLLTTTTLTKPYRDFFGLFQYGLLHFGHIIISLLRGVHVWLQRTHLSITNCNFMRVSVTYA